MKEIRVMVNGEVGEYTVAEAKAQGKNQWEGWTCPIGLDCLYIDFDGMVWRGPCTVGEPIGNILGTWKEIDEMTECPRKSCDCGTGIKLTKTRKDDPNNFYTISLQPEPIQIQWDLGRRCNFDCSYCWPNNHNKTDGWWRLSVMIHVVNKISDMYLIPVQFNICGGEPTLHPDFVEFLTYIQKHGHTIHLQTNGTASPNRMRQIARLATVSISVHFEFAKVDNLAKRLDAMTSVEHNGIEVKFMVAPGGFPVAHEWFDQLKKYTSATFIATPMRDPVTNDLLPYTDEELQEFGTWHTNSD